LGNISGKGEITVYTRLLVDSSISRSVILAKNSVQNQRLAYKSNLKMNSTNSTKMKIEFRSLWIY